MPNLILSRRAGETILIGDDIEITMLAVDAGAARISVRAPQAVRILRAELKPKASHPAISATVFATPPPAVPVIIRRKRRYP